MNETPAQRIEAQQTPPKAQIAEHLLPSIDMPQTYSMSTSFSPPITKAEISLASKPFAIAVDTPTDWPAIFVPFVLGAAAVYFTLSGQRQQIRSSTANFRQEWIAHLRNACVDFSAAAGEIKMRFGVDSNFVQTQEFWTLVNRLVTAQSTILLMIDTSAGPRERLGNAMKQVIDRMQEAEGDGFRTGLHDFRSNSRVVLDEAWRDMKRDLGHAKPWFSRPRTNTN